MPGAPATRPRLRAAVLAVALGLAAAGCSDDGGSDDGSGDGEMGGTGTTATTVSFEEKDAALQLNIAATGMNIVATDVALRAGKPQGADYCRTTAPAELEPHRTVLEAADDAEVRQGAQAALAELRTVLDRCVDGGDSAAVAEGVQRYNEAFQRLQRRIATLLDRG